MRKFIPIILICLILSPIILAMSTWTNSWLSDSSIASTIDDQVNALSTAVYERERNGGQYWPNGSADVKSGINAIQSSNFVSGEWNVYESDLSTKSLTLTDTTATIGSPTTFSTSISVTGTSNFTGAVTAADLTVTGNFVANNDKRIIIASISGRGDGSAPDVENAAFYVPQGITGTIVEVEASNDGIFAGSSSEIQKYSPTWSSNSSTGSCISSGTVVATLNFSGVERHRRSTTISSATVAAGDIICIDRGGNTGGYQQYNIYIAADW